MPTNALDQQRPSQLLERLLDTPNLPQVVRELDKTFERPKPRAVAGAWENAHQQFASLRLFLL